MKFISILLLLSASALAQPAAPLQGVTTSQMRNGRWWLFMDKGERGIYLFAVFDALNAAPPPNAKDWFSAQFTINEVREAIDQLYAAPENRIIPIVYAVRICMARFNGAPKQEVEDLTSVFRMMKADP